MDKKAMFIYYVSKPKEPEIIEPYTWDINAYLPYPTTGDTSMKNGGKYTSYAEYERSFTKTIDINLPVGTYDVAFMDGDIRRFGGTALTLNSNASSLIYSTTTSNTGNTYYTNIKITNSQITFEGTYRYSTARVMDDATGNFINVTCNQYRNWYITHIVITPV